MPKRLLPSLLQRPARMSGNIMIIGGSSGIGLELTRQLLSKNYTVFSGSRSKPDLSLDRLKYFHYDVLGDEAFPAEIEHLDGLAYLPGTINLRPFHRLKPQDFLEESLAISVVGSLMDSKGTSTSPPSICFNNNSAAF